MPASDLALLIEAARAAGELSCQFSGQEAHKWEKPGGAGPVTEVDLAVNALLKEQLRSARPEYGWLSEETEDSRTRLDRDTVFIIDPIDGTRSFIEGSNTWAHALAVAHKGEVTAAVIYLPMRDKLYGAAKGQGATLNQVPIQTGTQEELSGADVLAARPVLDEKHWRSKAPDIKRSYRPSLAYRLALIAEGRFDAMLTLRKTWEWDIAAGDLIAREAGAVISDRNGEPLRFNNPEPKLNGVILANQVLHSKLAGMLKPK
ncbi:MAG: 3'(2'),5'-bisphosphate nucleotidase CysQ [Pseudomonadota bacterium]